MGRRATNNVTRSRRAPTTRLGPPASSRSGQLCSVPRVFDVWFKQEVVEITGVDLNQPPSDLPQVLFD
jgi:hypothetical protein